MVFFCRCKRDPISSFDVNCGPGIFLPIVKLGSVNIIIYLFNIKYTLWYN